MALATLTNSGRAAIAKAISENTLHLAWGTGDPAWDAPDAELPSLVEATALVNEVGRHALTRCGFVLPDEAGDIIIPVSGGANDAVQEARYRKSDTPTPYLYIYVQYDYGDASNAVIREYGLFMGTTLTEGLPPGQRYFTPAQVQDTGLLMAVQIVTPPINRSPSVRQSVEFVMPI